MVMSRDPDFKFPKFYLSPNSVLNFRKSYQIWENWFKNKKVTGKKQTGGGGGKHPPTIAYRVKLVMLVN